MKGLSVVFLLVFVGVLLLFLSSNFNLNKEKGKQDSQIKMSKMKILSTAFENNQSIPKKYTCQGENINPPLSFEDVTQNTKSLALIMDDPDAPTGTFVHWVIFNINPKTTSMAENSFPSGSTQGKNNVSTNKYVGPCPPSGTHRYFFKLYALDTTLYLAENADKNELENAIKGHILDEAQIIGLYQKK